VLAFSGEDHDEIQAVYDSFRTKTKRVNISPLTDAYTSGLALACVMEVKDAGGSATEAETQLAVFHAAMLWKIRELINMARKAPMSPEETERLVPSVVGWTIIGHTWSLHISSLQPDGSIVSFAHLSVRL
jgi:hypothetical protein